MTAEDRPLAVLGARPAFAEPLHVGQPGVAGSAAFFQKLEAVMARRWLTNDGPCVAELERRLTRQFGVGHCVAVSSGTMAISLLARAAGLRGDVIVPSLTFVATAHALEWVGLRPVFCDVDPVSWTMDPDACEAALTPATCAILGVHLFGQPCDVDALQALATRHGLALFFDAAHAFGCEYERGRLVGSGGAAEAFSFHATKVFHTFEGGAVATDRDDLAGELRLLRNFGFHDAEVVALGINGKLAEPAAAMGLANLETFDATLAAGRATVQAYVDGLAGVPGVRMRAASAGPRQNGHYAILEVTDPDAFGLDRDTLVRVLTAEHVLARRYFFPGVHAMEPYRSRDPHAAHRLPVTCQAVSRVVALPAGASIDPGAVPTVCAIIAAAHAHAAEILAALAPPHCAC
jgi:dTDP-4-amino-4,6-dideoxygalactose transaminase